MTFAADDDVVVDRDAEETRAFLDNKGYRFDPALRPRDRLDVRLNGLYLPGLYIGYVQYGANTIGSISCVAPPRPASAAAPPNAAASPAPAKK